MIRDSIIRQLIEKKRALTQFKVKSLALFGSVARGDFHSESDVDILVEFEGPATFDQYMELKEFLEKLLQGCRIDLLTRRGIRPELLPTIIQEALYVT